MREIPLNNRSWVISATNRIYTEELAAKLPEGTWSVITSITKRGIQRVSLWQAKKSAGKWREPAHILLSIIKKQSVATIAFEQQNVFQLTALPRPASTVQSSMKETVGSLAVVKIHAAYLASTQSRNSKHWSGFTESHSCERFWSEFLKQAALAKALICYCFVTNACKGICTIAFAVPTFFIYKIQLVTSYLAEGQKNCPPNVSWAGDTI